MSNHIPRPADIDDRRSIMDTSVMVAMEKTYAKLASLSEERAQRVLSLIEDLAELEALEEAEDLVAARSALAEPGPNIPLEELAKELGV